MKVVVKSYVIAAVMEVLNMSKLDDIPSNPSLISVVDWTKDVDVRKDSLYALSAKVIDEFVDLKYINDVDIITSSDNVKEYSNLLLCTGMLYLEYCDAIQKGDGIRVLRCWRYMLLLFKSTGRTNYSIEAFHLLAQYHFLLSTSPSVNLE